MINKKLKLDRFVFFAVLLVASLIYTAVPTKAYTGGLLNGVTLNEGANVTAINKQHTSMTDNNEATGSTVQYSNYYIWYEFSSEQTIDAYQIYLNGGEVTLYFYDASGVIIYTKDMITPNIAGKNIIPRGPVTGVKKVAMKTMINGTIIREVDVFGGADTTAPASPTGLIATAGDTLVNLSWTANSEPDIVGYNIYRDGVKINTTILMTPSFSDTGLTNGQTYSYQVSAVDTTGNESALSAAVQATPQAPVAPGRALVVITLENGLEKEYDLTMVQVNAFIDWYDAKAAGTGPARYVINKTYNLGAFTSRKDYLVFDKILTFEVMEYTVQ